MCQTRTPAAPEPLPQLMSVSDNGRLRHGEGSRGRGARRRRVLKLPTLWGTIAAILVIGIMPLGTTLGVYALWFFFSAQGKDFYATA